MAIIFSLFALQFLKKSTSSRTGNPKPIIPNLIGTVGSVDVAKITKYSFNVNKLVNLFLVFEI